MQTWFYEDNKKVEIGNRKYWIYSTLQVYQRSYSQVGHIPPKMSDKFESTLSKSDYLVGHRGRGRESGYLKIFFYISRGEHVKHFVINAYL